MQNPLNRQKTISITGWLSSPLPIKADYLANETKDQSQNKSSSAEVKEETNKKRIIHCKWQDFLPSQSIGNPSEKKYSQTFFKKFSDIFYRERESVQPVGSVNVVCWSLGAFIFLKGFCLSNKQQRGIFKHVILASVASSFCKSESNPYGTGRSIVETMISTLQSGDKEKINAMIDKYLLNCYNKKNILTPRAFFGDKDMLSSHSEERPSESNFLSTSSQQVIDRPVSALDAIKGLQFLANAQMDNLNLDESERKKITLLCADKDKILHPAGTRLLAKKNDLRLMTVGKNTSKEMGLDTKESDEDSPHAFPFTHSRAWSQTIGRILESE